MASSSRSPSRQKSKSRQKVSDRNKLFVTNLDGTANQNDLKEDLKTQFQKYGKVNSLIVRRNKNGDYSFAFVVYEPGFDAQKVVEDLNQKQLRGKKMTVEFQDDTKRRKDPDNGCYTCGKKGHFARECRSKNGSGGGSRHYRGRSRSRSRSKDDRKKRHRSPSQSSEKQRRHKKKKDRKQRSRDKDEKKKKKHKKHRGSSSDSRS